MRKLCLWMGIVSLLAGCATPANYYDPLEPMNRATFAFNQKVDTAVLKPVAKTYDRVTPGFVQSGIRNFFGNIDDVFSAGNSLLQGKFKKGGQNGLRVLLNSTLGLAGLFDLAGALGIEKHKEDFGQTLGHWGVGSGPYLVLPLWKPTTLRDVSDDVMGFAWSPTKPLVDEPTRYGMTALKLTDARARILPYDSLLQDALDPYSFVRDAYLQNRYFDVYDGQPPAPLAMGEPEDDAAPAAE